jgi:hypothetical protein
MKLIAVFTGLVCSLSLACAAGTYAPGQTSTKHDGGTSGAFGGGDSGSSNTPQNDGGTVKPPQDDGGTTTNCTGTMCGTDCVDTSSDPNNCGTCGNACDTTSDCIGGQCTPTTTSNEPPQGTCGHSLCSSGDYLDEGCDTAGCTVVICDPNYLYDDYCCSAGWDSQCIDEVNTYCSPYSCN